MLSSKANPLVWQRQVNLPAVQAVFFGHRAVILTGNYLTCCRECSKGKTCLAIVSTAQTLIVRDKHAFNRAVLKPKVRCHFPKPMEVKRINVHGWNARMSTPEGRRVLMNRILKGRHNLSH